MGALLTSLALTPLENTLRGFASALLAKDRERGVKVLQDTFLTLTHHYDGEKSGVVVDTVSSRQVVGQNISEIESRVSMIMAEVFESDGSADKQRSRSNFKALMDALVDTDEGERVDSVEVNIAVVANSAVLDRLRATTEVRYTDNLIPPEELSEQRLREQEEKEKREAQAARRRIIRNEPLPLAWHRIRIPPRGDVHGDVVANCLFVDDKTEFDDELVVSELRDIFRELNDSTRSRQSNRSIVHVPDMYVKSVSTSCLCRAFRCVHSPCVQQIRTACTRTSCHAAISTLRRHSPNGWTQSLWRSTTKSYRENKSRKRNRQSPCLLYTSPSPRDRG